MGLLMDINQMLSKNHIQIRKSIQSKGGPSRMSLNDRPPETEM